MLFFRRLVIFCICAMTTLITSFTIVEVMATEKKEENDMICDPRKPSHVNDVPSFCLLKFILDFTLFHLFVDVVTICGLCLWL